MEHLKTYFKNECDKNGLKFIVEGPVESQLLKNYSFHEGLKAFRQPKEQHQAIIEISALTEGRIIIARVDKEIIGYITYLHPDPYERWSDGNHPFIMELGAIEVALEYRNYGVASEMLRLSMLDDYLENYIIITTEYYWHWDLKNSGLDVYEYKDLMIRFMEKGGFEVFSTNDPEITGHPANTLMARIGKNINDDQLLAFDKIRFKNRFFF